VLEDDGADETTARVLEDDGVDETVVISDDEVGDAADVGEEPVDWGPVALRERRRTLSATPDLLAAFFRAHRCSPLDATVEQLAGEVGMAEPEQEFVRALGVFGSALEGRLLNELFQLCDEMSEPIEVLRVFAGTLRRY
jgi:hypothetical protein